MKPAEGEMPSHSTPNAVFLPIVPLPDVGGRRDAYVTDAHENPLIEIRGDVLQLDDNEPDFGGSPTTSEEAWEIYQASLKPIALDSELLELLNA